jgi:hypothetical protein
MFGKFNIPFTSPTLQSQRAYPSERHPSFILHLRSFMFTNPSDSHYTIYVCSVLNLNNLLSSFTFLRHLNTALLIQPLCHGSTSCRRNGCNRSLSDQIGPNEQRHARSADSAMGRANLPRMGREPLSRILRARLPNLGTRRSMESVWTIR